MTPEGTQPTLSTRVSGGYRASTYEDCRVTASSYLVPEKAPCDTRTKLDNQAKPSINVKGLIHEEGIKYAGTFDSIRRMADRVTIYRARI